MSSLSLRTGLLSLSVLLGGCSFDWNKHAQGELTDAAVDAASASPHVTKPHPDADSGALTPDDMPVPPAPTSECDATHPCPTDFECLDAKCTFVPPPRLPSSLAQTSGGGTVSSGGRVLRVTLGAPQPFGAAASANFRLRLGPSAGK